MQVEWAMAAHAPALTIPNQQPVGQPAALAKCRVQIDFYGMWRPGRSPGATLMQSANSDPVANAVERHAATISATLGLAPPVGVEISFAEPDAEMRNRPVISSK